MSAVGPIHSHFAPFLPPVKEETSSFSPEIEDFPETQKEKVGGDIVERAGKILSLDFGFSLKEFLGEVIKAINNAGGKIAGIYSKGGINDHILLGKKLSTSDLDISIKLDEEAGAFFYQKTTWRRLREKIVFLLELRKIEEAQLKNLYLHFDPKNREYYFLVSIPAKGQLKAIDLQIVLKQNISCLSSYDAIQIDLMPFLKAEKGRSPTTLMAKSMKPYVYARCFNLKRAGLFEVEPSARLVRKGLFDLSRRFTQGVMPSADKMIDDYWLGFQDQYFQEGEGVFGAFEDDLWRYLKDHFGYDDDPKREPKQNNEIALRSLFYLVNKDFLIRHFCVNDSAREALRLIISKYAHRVLGLKEAEDNRDLIALDEVECALVRTLPRKEAHFITKHHQNTPSPSFLEFTLPSKEKCFLFNQHFAIDPRQPNVDPSTMLARKFLALLSPVHSVEERPPLEEKESLLKSREIASARAATRHPVEMLNETADYSLAVGAAPLRPKQEKVEAAPIHVPVSAAPEAAFPLRPKQEKVEAAPIQVAVSAAPDASLPRPKQKKVKAPPIHVAVSAAPEAAAPVRPKQGKAVTFAPALVLVEVPHLSAVKEKIARMRSFKDFISFAIDEIVKMDRDEWGDLGDGLLKLYEQKFEQLKSLTEVEMNGLKARQVELIKLLSQPERSLNNKKLAANLICILASKLNDKEAFQRAWDFMVQFKGKDKEQEIEIYLWFYNKFFSSVFEPHLAFDMILFLFRKMEGLEERNETMAPLFKPFEKSVQFFDFFFRESDKILRLPPPLFFEFLKVVLKKAEKIESENNETILLSCLARYEREKSEANFPPFDFEPVLGVERAKIKEKYEQFFGIKKAVSKKVVKKKKDTQKAALADLSKKMDSLHADYVQRLEHFSKASPFVDVFESVFVDLNQKMKNIIEPFAKKFQKEVVMEIMASFTKWHEIQVKKIRDKKERSLSRERALNCLIVNRQRFLMEVLPLFPLEERNLFLGAFFSELKDHLLAKEVTLFNAVHSWIFHAEAHLLCSNIEELYPHLVTFREAFLVIYPEGSALQEALAYLEIEMIHRFANRGINQEGSKEVMIAINNLLVSFLNRDLKPLFLRSSLSSIFICLDDLSKKNNENKKAVFKVLKMFFDPSFVSLFREWFAQIQSAKRNYVYEACLRICEGEEREGRDLLLEEIERNLKPLLEHKEFPRQFSLVQAVDLIDYPALVKSGLDILRSGVDCFDSLQIAERLIANKIDSYSIWGLKARALDSLGMHYSSLFFYEKALDQLKNSKDKQLLDKYGLVSALALAEVLFREGEVMAGDLIYAQIVQMGKKEKGGLGSVFLSNMVLFRGEALSKLGYWKECEENYRIALETDPQNLDLLCGLAEAYLKLGNKKLEIECYKKAILLAPRKEFYVAIASIYEKAKEYDNAIRILEEWEGQNIEGFLLKPEQFIEVDCRIIKLFLKKNDSYHAWKFLIKLFEKNPTKAEAFWSQEIRTQLSIKSLEKELRRKANLNEQDGEALTQLQLFYYLEKKWQLAIEVSEKIDQLDGFSSEPFHLTISEMIYSNVGDWERAIVCYERLSVVTPDPSVLILLANLYWNAGKFEKAYKVFESIEEKADLNSRDYERYGVLAFINKEWEKALTFFERSTRAFNPLFVQEDRLSPEILGIMKSLSLMKMNRCNEAAPILLEFLEDEEETNEDFLEATFYAALKTNQVEKFDALLSKKREERPDLQSIIDPILVLTTMSRGREAEFLEDYEKSLNFIIQNFVPVFSRRLL